jgi:hypothetical protein
MSACNASAPTPEAGSTAAAAPEQAAGEQPAPPAQPALPAQPPPVAGPTEPAPAAPPPGGTTARSAEVKSKQQAGCPAPRKPPSGLACIQMIAARKDPATGVCCQFPTPCHVPDQAKGWQEVDHCP